MFEGGYLQYEGHPIFPPLFGCVARNDPAMVSTIPRNHNVLYIISDQSVQHDKTTIQVITIVHSVRDKNSIVIT